MNNKAQFEIEPAPLILAAVAAIASFVMASRMNSGFVYSSFVAVVTLVASYFIVYNILNR